MCSADNWPSENMCMNSEQVLRAFMDPCSHSSTYVKSLVLLIATFLGLLLGLL
jgi:hypothetical protein